jgi:hypothetical protein
MNSKLLFLVYGVFAVGNNYQVTAQIIAAACGDAFPQNGLSSASAADAQTAPQYLESHRQVHPPPPTDSSERRRRRQLLYCCQFSGEALQTFVC